MVPEDDIKYLQGRDNHRMTGDLLLAVAIRCAMSARGRMTTELAREIGVNKDTLAGWRFAYRRVPAEILERLETALKVRFKGVRRSVRSPTHAGKYCGRIRNRPIQVICRATGSTIFFAERL